MKHGTFRPLSRRPIISALISLSILAPCGAWGAIRCQGLVSKAEQVICKSEELISLDQALNDAYSAALSTVADQTALRKAQKDWLRSDRDRCDEY